MNKKSNKTLVTVKSLLDLHNKESQKFAIYGLLVLLGIIAVLIRVSLMRFQNVDYQIFSSWYSFAKLHGIHSLKYTYSDGFSNYNSPYSYFLVFVTYLPVSKIVAIKGLLGFFDLILAASVYFLVKLFVSKKSLLPILAGLITLFLPTVLINGVFWGQFDQLYVAFIIFSLYFGLKDNSKLSWLMFGVAVAVKLQAIFFLPVLVILCFKKVNIIDFYYAAIAYLVLSLPPMLLGRPFMSILSIYPDQAKLFSHQLTLNAPNIYQWVPNSAFNYLNTAGIYLAIAVLLLVIIFSVLRKLYDKLSLLIVTTLFLYLAPFLLPAMHERYFFPAGIASAILAIVSPTAKNIGMAIAAQVATFFSYCPFLFGSQPLPLGIVAIVELVIIAVLFIELVGIKVPIATKKSTS